MFDQNLFMYLLFVIRFEFPLNWIPCMYSLVTVREAQYCLILICIGHSYTFSNLRIAKISWTSVLQYVRHTYIFSDARIAKFLWASVSRKSVVFAHTIQRARRLFLVSLSRVTCGLEFCAHTPISQWNLKTTLFVNSKSNKIEFVFLSRKLILFLEIMNRFTRNRAILVTSDGDRYIYGRNRNGEQGKKRLSSKRDNDPTKEIPNNWNVEGAHLLWKGRWWFVSFTTNEEFE